MSGIEQTEEVAPPPQRVVSLLGAATEVVFRLGLGHRLVGRSHECDFPPAVLSLPMISRPRLDPLAPSKAIDDAVRQCASAGEPVYALDNDELSALTPDLLIAQDACRVCAVTPREVAQSSCAAVPQLILQPSTLEDCLCDVQRVAAVLGVAKRGDALRRTIEAKIDRVREVVRGNSGSGRRKVKVALLEWCDPVMGCGYWLPELVEAAGGEALLSGGVGGKTPTVTFEELLAAEPEVVVFALCGFGVTRAAREVEAAWGATRLEQLQAALAKNRNRSTDGSGGGSEGQREHIFVVDGNYLVNRSGPRVAESCEVLAEAIHLELRGHFGHLGTELLASWAGALSMARDLGDSGRESGSAKVRPAPAASPAALASADQDHGNKEDEERWQEEPVDEQDMTPAEAAVVAQLHCLAAGDFMGAFALNSAANQERWCGPHRFASVLRSHPTFSRLLPDTEEGASSAVVVRGASQRVTTGDAQTVTAKGALAVVRVLLPGPRATVSTPPSKASASTPSTHDNNAVMLEWTMVLEHSSSSSAEAVWRTEKVGLGN